MPPPITSVAPWETRGAPSQRWVRVFNQSGEVIPGFACMRILTDLQPTTATERSDTVWIVGKPNATLEASQDHTQVIFNGPLPIAASGHGQYGFGTRDFPCQSLFRGVASPTTAGPAANSWQLHPGLSAFRYLGFDFPCITIPGAAAVTAQESSVGRGWFTPAFVKTRFHNHYEGIPLAGWSSDVMYLGALSPSGPRTDAFQSYSGQFETIHPFASTAVGNATAMRSIEFGADAQLALDLSGCLNIGMSPFGSGGQSIIVSVVQRRGEDVVSGRSTIVGIPRILYDFVNPGHGQALTITEWRNWVAVSLHVHQLDIEAGDLLEVSLERSDSNVEVYQSALHLVGQSL